MMNTKNKIIVIKSLFARRFPEIADKIHLGWLDKENGLDVFELESPKNGELNIYGSSAIAIAVGLNWYLKHVCKYHISWCGRQRNLQVADIKPITGGRKKVILPHRHIVYMNYCTFNYSASWWDWERWEWEIDFMAMNGVNMPLAMVGLEGVWYHSLLRAGLTDEEARKFLVGPAFFAWQWMANIDEHGGPLPKSWIDSHIELGQKIIQRMLEFGMNPIQQGFSGHVPAVFKEKFPEANIIQKEKWCEFPGTWQLDPLDPLFMKFGHIFMEEQKRFFGLHSYYAADPFHESTPPQPGDEYLRQVGNTIHSLFDEVDSNSTWVMQSWSIQKEIVCAVPKNRLLIVDLSGRKWIETDGFWGYNFLVGQLHNFGGRINLHGDLKYVASNPFMESKEKYSQAVGMGLFMEGITQNPVFYDLVFDMIWQKKGIQIETWLNEYAERRYGVSEESALKAWKILLQTAYSEGTNEVESSSIVAARPALDVKKSGPNEGFKIPYDQQELAKAWKLLIDAKAKCKKSDGYRFDLVDVGRQVLSNLGQCLHQNVKIAFEKKNIEEFNVASKLFLELLDDIDSLLKTRIEYRFSEWLKTAINWGNNDSERKLYAKNAAMLVTLWGPEEEPVIFDYSWREWAGLIKKYYLPRWEQFHQFLREKIELAETYQEVNLPQVYGRESWRANEFYNMLANWEGIWINRSIIDDMICGNDELKVSESLYRKWINKYD